MVKIINGKALAEETYQNLEKIISKLEYKICLAVILVGEDPASQIYVRNKVKTCERLNITSKLINLPNNITEKELKDRINELNSDDSVDGILIQAPLPKHINEKDIFDSVSKAKDVDGFCKENVGDFVLATKGIIPCTVKGIIKMLKSNEIKLEGLNAVVIGRSNIVGKPMANYLINQGSTVTICNSKTQNLQFYTKNADLIISATGVANLIKEEDIKENAIIIDVGITRVNDKLCGDVDFDNVSKKARLITPVPGGVGPMTIAMLMDNVVSCAIERRKNNG